MPAPIEEVPPKVTVAVPAVKVPLFTQGPLTVRPKVVIVSVPPLLMVMPAMVAAAETVTLLPLAMITTSVVAGTVPPGQGAFGVIEFQLPLPAVVIVAA